MAESKIRVGIVGAGGIGGLGGRENSHAGGYRRCEEAELLAIADFNEERLNQFGDEWEIAAEHRYGSADEMFEKVNLDVVSVTTDNFHHHQPVIAAAEAGVKVIMVEKPLAISVEWGRKMVEACEANGARLLVDHTRRFLPHFQKLRKMIDDDAIGRIKTITYNGCRPLLHNGTHNVDYTFFFAPVEPKLVAGFLNDEEVADPGGAVMIICEGDIVIYVNCICTRKEHYGGCEIAGTEGRIEFHERNGVWRYGPLVEAPGDGYGMRYDMQPIPDMPKTHDLADYFYHAARDAVECFIEDRESVSSGRDGLKALEVITAAHISHKTGTMVPLPLADGLDRVEIRSTGR